MSASANALALGALAILAAYLIGSIPFGYLTARWARGIDIRTVGSGNIGATNVGRVLGFRFFVLVFLLDLLKGFLPTYAFPRGVAEAAGRVPPDLAVLVALATILGHNFPAYLKLRGGKGVATSLGALLALDWVASVSAAVGFVVFLLVTRFVSMSSLLGGLVFLGAHFARVDDPWNREHLAMSLATVGLLGLLFVRHRKNLARIREGTEPRVSLRRKTPPAGKVAWVLVPTLALAVAAATCGLAWHSARRAELTVGSYRLVEVERVATGHQRAERLTFAGGGTRLAVSCPRYNRVVVYRVTGADRLEVVRDVELAGRPVAVWATADRLYVLERPAGDRRHVEPGWWETFDLDGQPVGSRQVVGMYPDDLAVTPDGRHALVLTSGRAEGDANRPAPALDVYELGDGPARVVGHLAFDRDGDDPARLSLSSTGGRASVALLGSDELAAIDLTDREHPRLLERTALAAEDGRTSRARTNDPAPMASAPDRDAVLLPPPTTSPDAEDVIARTRPGVPGLDLSEATTRRDLGRLEMRAGGLNLSVARPVGLAVSPERGLLAVATRSGSVHLIATRPRADDVARSGGGRDLPSEARTLR